MPLLLCSATPFEIQPTVNYIHSNRLDVVTRILVTGIGSMATTYSLMKQISINRPSMMIQAGVAGSFDPSISLQSVLAVTKEKSGDLGVVENKSFKSIHEIGLENENAWPWNHGWLENHSQPLKDCQLQKASGVTVNEISTSPERINYYRQTGAQVESMEGAAFHYVALKEDIPFLQLRAISNFIGERDKSKWKLQHAIEQLNKELINMIKKYC